MPMRFAYLLIALLLVVALPSLAELYTEWLWFGETGYQSVFLKTLAAKGLIGAAMFLPAFLFLLGNLRLALRGFTKPYVLFPGGGDLQPIVLDPRYFGLVAIALSAVVALFLSVVASSQWLTVLRFLDQTPFGQADPLFGHDVGFYVFTLPFLDVARYACFALVVLAAIGSVAAYVAGGRLSVGPEGFSIDVRARQHLLLLASAAFVLLAWGAYLDLPRLLTTPSGIVFGASFVDVNLRLFVLRGLLIVAGAAAVATAYAAFTRVTWPVAAGAGAYLLVWIGGGAAATALQQLVVTPDEQQREAPYLVHNIAATRQAFDLDEVEERAVSGDALLTLQDIENNAETINNVRLWDHQPLLDTFAQIQEIRTYYEFASVDNDRYVVDGEYRQTMVSSRELNSDSLPNRSWINERLQYTHGFGVALGPVNQVTQEGLPVLFIQDLPPRSETDLAVEQPSIYFGELSNDFVLVNTGTDEFHYPEGEDNVSTRYDGMGGVEIGNLFRRLLFSLRFRSYEILVSGQLDADSRVIYHRNISDRVATIAPFLRYDADPYLVIADGRLYWMRDAYTVSDRYRTRRRSRAASTTSATRSRSSSTPTTARPPSTSAEPDDPLGITLGRIFPAC